MPTRKELYDEMCRIMTDYEQGDYEKPEHALQDMYEMLVKLQNNWEEVITAQN